MIFACIWIPRYTPLAEATTFVFVQHAHKKSSLSFDIALDMAAEVVRLYSIVEANGLLLFLARLERAQALLTIAD